MSEDEENQNYLKHIVCSSFLLSGQSNPILSAPMVCIGSETTIRHHMGFWTLVSVRNVGRRDSCVERRDLKIIQR